MNTITAPSPVRIVERDKVLPREVLDLLNKALLDRFTGNIQLNVKDGRFVGARKEAVISFQQK